MKCILSKIINCKSVTLYFVPDGSYMIKSGNFSQTFKKTSFDDVLNAYFKY